MRFFKIEKLVRDKTFERAIQRGAIPHGKKLVNDQEFDQALRLKILEEAHEVVSSPERTELGSEIADLLEAISTLANLHNISDQDIATMRAQKNHERGGFGERVYATYYEVPEEGAHEMLTYLLDNPEKYPEIGNPRNI